MGGTDANAAQPRRVPLRAGPVSLAYVAGDLRDLVVGDTEVLRRIYVVFQDRNWTARPWVISDERILAGAETFEITFSARGTFDAEPFHFEATLSGDEEGTITYDIDGSTDAPFLRNRLGLCVLHPMTAAGAPCIVESVAGVAVESAFPMGIAPHQPFRDIRAITHEFAPQAWASVRMSGETFEMEDHRNWSDASFKTYCTPIDLPFPVEVRPGDTIWQGATVAVDIEDADIAPFDDAVGIHLLDDVAPLPALGLQVAADEVPAVAQLGKLRSLGLDHLRLDLRSSDPDAKDRIADAAVQAAAIGARLIVAATIEDPADLFALATSVDVVDTWLVFDAHAKTTGRPLVAAARAALGAQARIGGGTNLYFAELNREPVDPTGLAVVAFSMNPQVHAADDATLVQNLAAQEVVVLNAGRIAGATPLLVGPVTLRPRFNPNATAPEPDASGTALPANVDARQVSPLAACWTAMSLKYLAEAGTVSAITFFETVGWRGVMERAEGSRQPADFPSTPGMVFPLYEILAAARGFTRVRLCQADNAARVDALVFEDDSGRRRVIVANFTDCEQDVPLVGFGPDLTHARLDPCGFAILDGRTAP